MTPYLASSNYNIICAPYTLISISCVMGSVHLIILSAMRRISCWLFPVIGLFVYTSAISQDSQFSQFYANPHYLNPALTGSHSGTYRVVANYRDQWDGALNTPFSTISVGGDLKYDLRNPGSFSKGNDLVAIGIQFFSDRVGLLNYNTTQLSLFGAFHKLLDKETTQYLSVGLQLGLAQRGISITNLNFQDQFNGIDQFNFPTQEILPANSQVAPDVSVGLHYSITPKKNNSYYIGVAYQHWNEPNISFFDRDLSTTQDFESFSLDARFTAHASASFPLSPAVSIEPRTLYLSQGQSQSAVVGVNLRYKLIDSDEFSTHLGLWMRTSRSLSVWQPTDAILSFGIGKNGLLVGVSYDANLRNLTGTTLGTSTLELSISYTGNHENGDKFCPEF